MLVLFGEGYVLEWYIEYYLCWEWWLIGKLKCLIGDFSDGVGDSFGVLFDEECLLCLEIFGDFVVMLL